MRIFISYPVHLYHSGRFARGLALPTTCLLITCVAIGIGTNLPVSAGEDVFAAVILATLIYFFGRSLTIGVWLKPTQVLVRSWFRTYALAPDEIHRCDSAPYSGMLFGYRDSPFLSMLTLTLVDGSVISVRGMIATRNTTARQIRELRTFLSD